MRDLICLISGAIALTAGADSWVFADHESASAKIVVQVPADAKVYFDAYLTKQMGAIRTFVTPALPPGREHSYELKAEVAREGETLSKTGRIRVRAGQTTQVDLRDLSSPAAPGYIYTITNDPERNGIAVLQPNADGFLAELEGSPRHSASNTRSAAINSLNTEC